MSVFAAVGLQTFGGKIYVGNPDIKDLDFGKRNYYANNFNDFGSAMVTLFEILVATEWNVIMDAVVASTHTVWSHAYFIAFYCVGAVMVLNLVVAYILESFFDKDVEHRSNEKPEGIIDEEGSEQFSMQ